MAVITEVTIKITAAVNLTSPLRPGPVNSIFFNLRPIVQPDPKSDRRSPLQSIAFFGPTHLSGTTRLRLPFRHPAARESLRRQHHGVYGGR